jgi:hypothetical protein
VAISLPSSATRVRSATHTGSVPARGSHAAPSQPTWAPPHRARRCGARRGCTTPVSRGSRMKRSTVQHTEVSLLLELATHCAGPRDAEMGMEPNSLHPERFIPLPPCEGWRLRAAL